MIFTEWMMMRVDDAFDILRCELEWKHFHWMNEIFGPDLSDMVRSEHQDTDMVRKKYPPECWYMISSGVVRDWKVS